MRIRHWHMLLGLCAATVLHLGAGLVLNLPSVSADKDAKPAGTPGITISLSPADNAPVAAPTASTNESIAAAKLVKPEASEPIVETPVVKPKPVQKTKTVKTTSPVQQQPRQAPIISKPFVAAKPVEMEKSPLSVSNREQRGSSELNALKLQSKNSNEPSVTTGSADQKADYLHLLVAWLEQHKQYPHRARVRRQEGTVVLHFILNREGRVTYYRIEESSGYGILDKEVEAMIKRAQPLPKMPEDLQLASLELIVPVQFSLR